MDTYDYLSSTHGKYWEMQMLHTRVGRSRYRNGVLMWNGESRIFDARSHAMIEDLRDAFDTTTRYFKHKLQGFSYVNLMAGHLKHALRARGKAVENLAAGNGKGRETRESFIPRVYPESTPRILEAMHIYVDNIPKIRDWMQHKPRAVGTSTPSVIAESAVAEAWFTMMLRGMIWNRAHFMAGPPTGVPAHYYGSKMPVYIS